VKVYTNIDDYQNVNNPVATIGTFDGVHVGHQQIIKRLKEIAKKENGEVVLLTFHPHPRLVLQPENNDLKLINTVDEKIALLEKYGVDHLVLYPFTRDFSRLTSVEYVRDILVNKLKVQTLVIGYDHQFGRNREGGFEQLLEFSETYGFDVEEIPAHDIESVNVSSTKVRGALKVGDVETVKSYLGHAFTVTGIVVEGKKIGHTIGYPTANIKVENRNKIIPAQGVYAVKVRVLGGEYNGMLNIGVNPTVVENGEQTIEVNIFEFDQDIYGAQATVEFVARLRNEEHFESLDALRLQLNKDKLDSIKILG
jgi:riboflavin kinase/FMN adenylyltransferase